MQRRLIPGQVRKILPMLDSVNDGEALNAARAAGRVLRGAGLTYRDLASAIPTDEPGPRLPGDTSPFHPRPEASGERWQHPRPQREQHAHRTADDVKVATGAIVRAVAAGDLTPDEAGAVAGVIELHRRAIDTSDLAARIAALEAAQPNRS